MDKRKLLSYIVKRINASSRYYLAEITKKPRHYHELIGGRLLPSLKKGVAIYRDIDAFYLPTSAFLFEPEIVRYVTRLAHHDKVFANRLAVMELNADDIEIMVRTLTFNRIKLYMKGRRIFETSDDDF